VGGGRKIYLPNDFWTWTEVPHLVLFLSVVLKNLLFRLCDETTFSLVQLLVTSSSPQVILRQTVTMLMRRILSAQDVSPDVPSIRQLLSSIHQRHPVVLQKVGESLVLEGDEMKVPVEQLLISLSIVRARPLFIFTAQLILGYACQTYPDESSAGSSGDSGIINMIVDSANADVVVRVDALSRLINILTTSPNLSTSDLVRQL
jgi:hypothetical protein